MKSELPPGWSHRKLDELGFVGRGRSRHRPRNHPSLYGGPYPFFQTGDVKTAELYLSDYNQTYNEKGLAQSKLWEPGSLCITIAANIAESAILKIRGCFPDSIVGFIADPEKADVRFVKYAIDTMKLRMQSISRGTTQDNLSLDKLLTFDFLTPPPPTQRKIAAILSAYDDLIENNTKRIAILEEMAQAVYREWFVHFRFPGHEQVTMVDSELGPIPEGWEVKNLYDVAEVTTGFAFKSRRFTDQPVGLPVIRIRDIPKNSTKTYTDEKADEKYVVKNGDILIGMDGDFHMTKWAGGKAYLNQRVARIRPKGNLPSYYSFLTLRDPIQYFNSTITGTTVAHLGKKHLVTIDIVVPEEGVLRRVWEVIQPLLGMELNLRFRNANLRHTRDLLLPRLISGEVDVSNLSIDTGGMN